MLRKLLTTYPVADNARVHACSSVAMSEVWLFERHLLKVTGEAADEDSGGSARNFLQRDTTGLKSFVDDF